MSRSQPVPPGPRGWPIVGSAISFHRNPNGFLHSLARGYGDVTSFTVGRKRLYLLNRPDLVKGVLLSKPDAFVKGKLVQRARRLLGDGLITSNGCLHRSQRGMIQPSFHRSRLSPYGAVAAEYATDRVSRWTDREIVDVDREMMRLTMAIVAKTLFDADIDGEAAGLGESLDVLGKSLPLLMVPFRLERLPLPALRRVREALERLDAFVFGLIDDRTRNPGARDDVVSRLLAARDPVSGKPMERRLIRDEVLTLFLAGHETTAAALTWACYLVSRNPLVERRLITEVDAVLGGHEPSAGDVERLRYAEMIWKETLRLYPPVGRMGRRPVADYEADGYTIPAGSVMFVSPFACHRDPRYFDDPFRFDPSRWTRDATTNRPRFSYFPYGAGLRMCIGAGFANTVGVLVLAAVAQRFRLRLVPGHPVEPGRLLTVRPRFGMPMKAIVREDKKRIARPALVVEHTAGDVRAERHCGAA